MAASYNNGYTVKKTDHSMFDIKTSFLIRARSRTVRGTSISIDGLMDERVDFLPQKPVGMHPQETFQHNIPTVNSWLNPLQEYSNRSPCRRGRT